MSTANPASTNTSSLRAVLIPALKWLVAIVVLAVLYKMCSKDLAKLQERTVLWQMFIAALGIRLVSLIATFTRWRLLVRGIGLPMSIRETFRLGMLGEACNLMGPGAVGGDLVKAALLGKNHLSRLPSVLATVFLDRVLGMWALFVLGALASLIPSSVKLGPELQWAVWALWGGSLAGLVGLGLMFIPAFTHSRFMHWLTTWKFVGHIFKELMDSVQLYQDRPAIVLAAAGLGMLGHFGFLSAFYFCALSIHSGHSIPGFIDHVAGLPLPEVFSAAIPTPGGIGVLEGAIAWFYQQYQSAAFPDSTQEQLSEAFSNGVLMALVYRLTTLICAAIGVVFYLSSRGEIRQAVLEVDPEHAGQAA